MSLPQLFQPEGSLLDEAAIKGLLRGEEPSGHRVLWLGDGLWVRARGGAALFLGGRCSSSPHPVGEEPEDRDRAQDRRRPPEVGLLRPVVPGSIVSVGVILWGGHGEDCPVVQGRAQGGASGFPPSYHRRG